MALHQAQIHQTRPLGFLPEDFTGDESTSTSSSSSNAVSEETQLWIHHTSGLLHPVFKFLDIDSATWSGLEQTAGSSKASHHVGSYLRLLSKESDDDSSQRLAQELALAEAVGGMVISMKKNSESYKSKREKLREYEHQCREKFSSADVQSNSDKVARHLETHPGTETPFFQCKDQHEESSNASIDERPIEEVMTLSYKRKVAVLYELLSACLADLDESSIIYSRRRKGYDARHRVALRLLAAWLDIKWEKMEAIETMVACSAMALVKEKETKKEETPSKESKWAKLKRGGLIGAAALTGGTLLAITGGLAAPAIAAGLSALAPTLGTLIPVIGAGGFAAAATAAGHVAGSVAVAASFGADIQATTGYVKHAE
ncbi:hypothetical protein L6164_027661 [Bauhinia variegata]|uniref:Uncharacterized protein n=1 Tax=Bauhinia variegata TaxID=167791 RepID=A0ACB9LUU3_BAUVA|nr:hypothetical protein L6164_027661 [Bauhinia variegata]